MTRPFGSLERVKLREGWKSEEHDFTKWLASPDGLTRLADALGFGLELVGTERRVGRFEADILARRTDLPDEHHVVIENQLGKTDHDHLGKLLTYAAGHKAGTIIWVSAKFTDEHRAALDWLNDGTDERFEFYGLEIELWRIAGSPLAPKFNLVARPNDWARSVRRQAEGQLRPLQEQQRRYWEALFDLLRRSKTELQPQKAQPFNFAYFRIGTRLAELAVSTNSAASTITVALQLLGMTKTHEMLFEALSAEREAIVQALQPVADGAIIGWGAPEGQRERIALTLQAADPTDEADWPRQHNWLVQTLNIFEKTFRPRMRMPAGSADPDDPQGPGAVLDEPSEG